MRSLTTEDFWVFLASAPAEIQSRARATYRVWSETARQKVFGRAGNVRYVERLRLAPMRGGVATTWLRYLFLRLSAEELRAVPWRVYLGPAAESVAHFARDEVGGDPAYTARIR